MLKNIWARSKKTQRN